MRIACVQLSYSAGEPREDRLERGIARIREASADADLVVLPELWVTGYFSFERYAEEAESIDGPLMSRFRDLAKELRIHLLPGTFVERQGAGLANCAMLFDSDGNRVLTYRKVHLFGYESEEAKLLTPGNSADVATTALGPVGATTCYDLRFPELYRRITDAGAKLIVIPAAWPAARTEHWRLLLRARAVENQTFVVGCNGAGTQGNVKLAGHSVVIDPWGEVLAEAGSETETLTVDIDIARVDAVRDEFPVLQHRRIPIGGIQA